MQRVWRVTPPRRAANILNSHSWRFRWAHNTHTLSPDRDLSGQLWKSGIRGATRNAIYKRWEWPMTILKFRMPLEQPSKFIRSTCFSSMVTFFYRGVDWLRIDLSRLFGSFWRRSMSSHANDRSFVFEVHVEISLEIVASISDIWNMFRLCTKIFYCFNCLKVFLKRILFYFVVN